MPLTPDQIETLLSTQAQYGGDTAIALPAAATAVPWLRFEGIAKRFGSFDALRDIQLSVARGEFVCLLGPSGCGKTTLLRIVAGLEAQDAGRVWMGERDISRLPPAQRDYGIVFQSYALFPNLNAAENIAYGLRTGRAQKARRVGELLNLVGLPGSEAKYPAQLSGGQQQRVALARALATSPNLLLLDEPLSALDARVREHLRKELRGLQQQLGVTTLMVTHDQDEALSLADTIAVMSQGRIEQVGSPEQIYREPASRFVAGFVGQVNWLPLRRRHDGLLELAGLPLALPISEAQLPAGSQGELFCRPEDVSLVDMPWSREHPPLLGTVLQQGFLGGIRRVQLSLVHAPQHSLMAELPAHDPACARLAPGQRVALQFRPERLRCFGLPNS
ncbi:MAG: putative 2-aminoethylphosphonate ABC transporter ATP-binding protein [Paucibacter sp.]|nr:putative 2-aminoethylphosphonate ABC transporter ATP-binding protein [Roseateles sp.]